MFNNIFEFLVNIAYAQSVATVGGSTSASGSNLPDAGNIVVNIYNFALMVGGILAFGMIVYGAVKYTMAGGNPAGQSDARDIITQSLLGLLLLVGAFIVLNVINPELTGLGLPILGKIKPVQEGQIQIQAGGGLTQEAAIVQLDRAGVLINGPLNLAGIKQSTIEEVIDLKEECNCEVMITSATGGQHAQGEYSHANGYKVDLRLNEKLNSYIEGSGNFQMIGTRSDGALLYRRNGTLSSSVIYAKESDHWDVQVIP